MYTIGLRRLTIAPLNCDAPALLRYGAPRELALSAFGVVRDETPRGSLLRSNHGAIGAFGPGGPASELRVTFAQPNLDVLALVIGARLHNGALLPGSGEAANARGPGRFFALGYECFSVGDESEKVTSDASSKYQRTWLYKCLARLGPGQHTAAGASPKIAATTLILSVFPTNYRCQGRPLVDAVLPPGCAGGLEEVYIPV